MNERDPRISGPTLKVFRHLLTHRREECSGAAITKAAGVGAGTLYPLLARLEKARWVEGHWEVLDPSEAGRPRRRFYELTGVGATRARAELHEHQAPEIFGVTACSR